MTKKQDIPKTATVQIPRETWLRVRLRAAQIPGETIGGLLARSWKLLEQAEKRAKSAKQGERS